MEFQVGQRVAIRATRARVRVRLGMYDQATGRWRYLVVVGGHAFVWKWAEELEA